MLKIADINVNYEDVPYDVKSAFTIILVAEIIENILTRVYTFCKTSISQKLFIKMTRESGFQHIVAN